MLYTKRVTDRASLPGFRYAHPRPLPTAPPPLRKDSRERNRLHAKMSRMRNKFILDAIRDRLHKVEGEHLILRQLIKKHSTLSPGDVSKAISSARTRGGCGAADEFADTGGAAGGMSLDYPGQLSDGKQLPLLAGPGAKPQTLLERADYFLVDALTTGSRSFVMCDPKLPDNPIVYASNGFYKLTGYKPSEILGRNCRFLQGPLTDHDSIAIIRKGIVDGTDTTVLLVNYRADGSIFWNRFFIAPLRDVSGAVVSYVGVQEEVEPRDVERYLGIQATENKAKRAAGVLALTM